MKESLHTLLQAAETTAVAAGKLILEKQQQPRQLTSKGFRDIVTDADLASQQLITNRLLAQFPTHGFLPEEEDSTLPTTGPIIWAIDPIDGTTNYSRQLPDFSISIAAATDEGTLLVGVIYDPTRRELFSAAKGQGSSLNGQPIQVSTFSDIERAIFCLDWSRKQAKRQAIFNKLQRVMHDVTTIRSIGSAALAQAWIAAGRVDAYINYGLSAWDVAAGTLLVQEAGGKLSGIEGQSWQWQDTTDGCFATNGRFHEPFLKKLTLSETK